MPVAEHNLDRGELFPLSLSQRNIWDLERSFAGTSINNISTTIRIRGRLDFPLLQRSLNLVLASDESLRARLLLQNGEPYQYHAPFSPEQFPVFDFSLSSRRSLEHWEETMTREVLPLFDAPLYRFVLFRTGEHEGGVLVKTHHIISDGWSQVLLCNRIAEVYLQLLTGSVPELPPSPSYRLHVETEQRYLASPACARDTEYWRETLLGAGEPARVKETRGAALSPVGRRRTFEFSEVLNHAIYAFCLRQRVAPFAVFYMALAIYLRRMGASERFTIGVPIFNRMDLTERGTTGMFVSTLPFCGALDDNWSFLDFNEDLADRWYDLLRHQRLPYSNIEALAAERGAAADRLFHLALSYQDSRIFESRDASVLFTGRWHYSGYQSEQLCIHLSNMWDHKCYSVDYDYLAQVFSEREIESLHGYLTNILQEALLYPERPISKLSILGPEEKEKVLYTFNRTARLLHPRSLFEEFSRTAEASGGRVALICGGRRTTYRALLEAAGRYDAALRRLCPEEKLVAAILLPRCTALLEALAGVMRGGHAWLLMSYDLPEKRIAEILRRSGAAAVITDAAGAKRLAPAGISLPVLDVASVSDGAYVPPPSRSEPNDLAYVVYTSGSTGAPKGVEIEQRSLLNFADAMAPLYGQGAVLSLCSVGFDAFLIESASALFAGRTIVLATDEEAEDPNRLAQLILNYAVGFLSTTPSRLDACLANPRFLEAAEKLDTVLCGGEAFSGELLGRLRLHTGARIYNQYGPSETTVGVSVKLLNDCDRITIGKPMPNCRLYVLDDRLAPLPIGVYGSLYVGGVCVGRGYRNEPEMTAESFLESPFEPGERIYRTGDAAAWTAAGEIVLAGRLDRQVKLRGLRVEPQEAAVCLAGYPGVQKAAARVFEVRGQSILAAYYTSETPLDEAEIVAHLSDYLPRYMIPTHLERLEAIPLTPSGKVDEARLPAPPAPDDDAAAPDGPRQAEILDMFRRTLRQPDIGAGGDYFQYGGNSLSAMETIGEIEARFGVRLRVSDLYACRTARRLERYLSRAGAPEGAAAPIPCAPEAARHPLTPGQESLYVQSRMDETGLAYNMPGALRLAARPDEARLRLAFRRLIETEETLRTAFLMEDGGVWQKILPSAPFQLPVFSAPDFDTARRLFVRPFDLTKPPLLRAALWSGTDGAWTLFLDMHHLVGDGLTTPILLRRLDAFYRGEESAAGTLTYKDYAHWLRHRDEPEVSACRDWWRETLSDLPDPLELPYDRRADGFDFRGGRVDAALSPDLSRRCDAYCAEKGITPYALFASAFSLVLSKLTGAQDLIVGTPVSGRMRPELQEMCGLFMGTLPLRLRPAADLSVSGYLAATGRDVMALLDHQALPLEEIVSLLNLPRQVGRNALFRVLFSLRPTDAEGFSLCGAPAEYVPIPTETAKLDLSLEVSRGKDGYALHFEYAAALFDEATVRYHARCTAAALTALLADDGARLGDVLPLAPEDRLVLLERPRRLRTPYQDDCLDRMIAESALLTPDAPAVLWHGRALTYAALLARAEAVAGQLQAAGVKPGDRVALSCARTPDLFASLIGILMAGCAYIPVLPSFPTKRIVHMLETAGAVLLLCDAESRRALSAALPCRLLVLSDAHAAFAPPEGRTSTDLIHILFTSGSTGRPKGVMLTHRSIANLLPNIRAVMEDVPGPVLCSTNMIFDTFITESLLPLCMGKCVALADEEEMLLPWRLAALMRQTGSTVMQLTPSRLQMCLGSTDFAAAAAGLKVLILAGEALTAHLLASFAAVSGAAVVNLYGPTEAAVYVTGGAQDASRRVTIGKPLSNCRVYILDGMDRPVLPTARGELCLAGECLSPGYAGDEEKTAACFVPDPFVPGARMYRSGDIGRLLLSGEIEFCGRRDAQIKLNGQRVELGEIDGALLGAGAAQAVTIAVPGADGSLSLCAFLTAKEGAPLDAEALRRALRETLPAYMIPSEIVILDRMPYTASGKADLVALRARQASARAESGTAEPKNTDGGRAHASVPEEASEAPHEKPRLPTSPESAKTLPAPDGASSPDKPVSSPATDNVVSFPLKPAAPKKALPAAPHAPDGAAPPEPLTADDLAVIWRAALRREAVDPNRSFFEQGGTSLLALSVLTRYFDRGLTMSLTEFYDHPTLSAQAGLLAPAPEEPSDPEAPDDVFSASVSAAEAAEAAEPPLPARVPAIVSRGVRPLGTVFVTGATGFLGAHLARSLLDAGATRLICLTRDGARERLLDNLTCYFGGEWVQSRASQLSVVRGDIGKRRFALDDAAHAALAAQVNMVVNAAADIRHFAADNNHMRSNVQGAKNAAIFALRAGARLSHISTVSVAGDYLPAAPAAHVAFSEEDCDIGQNWRDNIYTKTKLLGEAEVYAAVLKGLEARVFRIGRLVGRASDGMFQRRPVGNRFYDLFRALAVLEAIPASAGALLVDLTPVDVCAEAVVALSGAPNTAYHIMSPAPMTLETLARTVLPHVRVLPDEAFRGLLSDRLREGGGSMLAPAVEFFSQQSAGPGRISPTAARTFAALDAAGFHWPSPAPALLLRQFVPTFPIKERAGDGFGL